MTSKEVYGTSLRECLKDIVEGRVQITSVICIYTKTALGTSGLEKAISRYGSLVFPNEPTKARELEDVFDDLIEAGKIKEERLSPRKRRPSSKNPLWLPANIDIETGIIWVACDKPEEVGVYGLEP